MPGLARISISPRDWATSTCSRSFAVLTPSSRARSGIGARRSPGRAPRPKRYPRNSDGNPPARPCIAHWSLISPPETAPVSPVAIVFGAGLRRNGTPTQVLADRVVVAAALFHQGRVARLLLSGSTRGGGYDEAGAMAALAVDLGVPPEALWVDNGGV